MQDSKSKIFLYEVEKSGNTINARPATELATDKTVIIFLGGVKYTSETESKYPISCAGTIEPFYLTLPEELQKNIRFFSVRSNTKKEALDEDYELYNESPLTHFSQESEDIVQTLLMPKLSPLSKEVDVRAKQIKAAKAAFSKINFITFSYGGCLLEEMANILGSHLKEYGFTDDEAKELVKCLGGISIAPVCKFVEKPIEIPQMIFVAANDGMAKKHSNVNTSNPLIQWSGTEELKIGKVSTRHCVLEKEIDTTNYYHSLTSDGVGQMHSLTVNNGHSKRLYTGTVVQDLTKENLHELFPSAALGEICLDSTIALLKSSGQETRDTPFTFDSFAANHLSAEQLGGYSGKSHFFRKMAKAEWDSSTQKRS